MPRNQTLNMFILKRGYVCSVMCIPETRHVVAEHLRQVSFILAIRAISWSTVMRVNTHKMAFASMYETASSPQSR